MWIFKHEFKYDGSLQWQKSPLVVVNGKSRQVGLDCDKSFSTIKSILGSTLSCS